MLLALLSVPRNLGYVVLAVLVGVEASGVPLPGETGLITASVLASQGHLKIELVIAIAAAAAIVGDNIGYLLGSRFGRRVLERPGRAHTQRQATMRRANALFERHGGKTVFFGRWITGLRIWAAWLAGMTTMPWRRFLVFNALGGIAWALCFGLLGYYAGEATAKVVGKVGIGAAIVFVVAVGIGFWLVRRRAEEIFTEPESEPDG